MQFIMIMMTKAYHTFLGFSWHICFADVMLGTLWFFNFFCLHNFFLVFAAFMNSLFTANQSVILINSEFMLLDVAKSFV